MHSSFTLKGISLFCENERSILVQLVVERRCVTELHAACDLPETEVTAAETEMLDLPSSSVLPWSDGQVQGILDPCRTISV